jgi:hypothetical protein
LWTRENSKGGHDLVSRGAVELRVVERRVGKGTMKIGINACKLAKGVWG